MNQKTDHLYRATLYYKLDTFTPERRMVYECWADDLDHFKKRAIRHLQGHDWTKDSDDIFTPWPNMEVSFGPISRKK